MTIHVDAEVAAVAIEEAVLGKLTIAPMKDGGVEATIPLIFDPADGKLDEAELRSLLSLVGRSVRIEIVGIQYTMPLEDAAEPPPADPKTGEVAE